MKDRIRQVMESQHMTQQVFADFIGIAPATLSGIFNDRTKPTINIVEAIKKKLPAISTDWLMFGSGAMYLNQTSPTVEVPADSLGANVRPTMGSGTGVQETMLNFDVPTAPVSPTARPGAYPTSGRNMRQEMEIEIMKNIDKTPRKVTEIRVFYDDQTWESFVPAKK